MKIKCISLMVLAFIILFCSFSCVYSEGTGGNETNTTSGSDNQTVISVNETNATSGSDGQTVTGSNEGNSASGSESQTSTGSNEGNAGSGSDGQTATGSNDSNATSGSDGQTATGSNEGNAGSGSDGQTSTGSNEGNATSGSDNQTTTGGNEGNTTSGSETSSTPDNSQNDSASEPDTQPTPDSDENNSTDESETQPTAKPVYTRKPVYRPTPTPVPYQPANTTEATQQPYTMFSTEDDKEKVYIFVFDAGYAMYGSSFRDAVVDAAGDPSGEIIKFVKQAAGLLINEKSIVVPVGFHSDAIKFGGLNVADSLNAKNHAEQIKPAFKNELFDSIINERQGERKSSVFFSTFVTVDDVLGIINKNPKYKDCEKIVIYIHGGVIQKSGGIELTQEQKDSVSYQMEELREKASLYSVGLDWTDTQYVTDIDKYNRNRVDQFFVENEIITVPVETSLEGDIDRNSTLQSMIKEIIRLIRGEQAAFVEIVPVNRKDDVVSCLELYDPEDLVVYSCNEANAKVYYAKKVWELKDSIDDILLEQSDVLWMCSRTEIEDMINFDQKRLFFEIVDDIEAKTAHGIDKNEGTLEIAIPADFMIEADTFTSDGRYIKLEVRDGKIKLSSQEMGVGTVVCKFGDYKKTINVNAIDSSLNWNWTDNQEYRMVKSSKDSDGNAIFYQSGDETKENFFVFAASDDFAWEIEEICGLHEGEIYSGDCGDEQTTSADGIEVNILRLTGKSNGIQMLFDRPGQFRITYTSKNEGHTEITETQTLAIRMPHDSKESITLVTPYFKSQPGQLIEFSSGGLPVTGEHYDVSFSSESILSSYYTENSKALYIVPEKAGSVDITISEKYFDNPEKTVIHVEVNSLLSDSMLWVYTVGAVVCLVGMSVAITVIIGKAKRSK